MQEKISLKYWLAVLGKFKKGFHIRLEKKILGIIPARGGSKGIHKKNIKNLNGKPLLAYTAEQALDSKKLNRVILSTEDPIIKKIGKELGLEVPFDRPSDLSNDDTPSLPVMLHVVNMLEKIENYLPDIIVLLQPTSPLRKTYHIDDAIDQFLKSDADSLVSVVEVPHSMSPFSAMELNDSEYLTPYKNLREDQNIRHKKPKFFARNGALYITTYKSLMNETLYGEKIIPYFMSKNVSLDLDDLEDWEIAEFLLEK